MCSRSEANERIDVIKYDIKMLRFCLQRLSEPPTAWTDSDRYLHLEGFLLHYRNLIRFFSGNQHRASDISMKRPQDFCSLSPGRAKDYRDTAKAWDNDSEGCDYRLVSAYLQHCTRKRTVFREWPFTEYYQKVEPLIRDFERDCLASPSPEVICGEAG